MLAEALATWWSPRADLAGRGAADRLDHALAGSAICLIPRPPLAPADVVSPESGGAPTFEMRGDPQALRAELADPAAPASGTIPPALRADLIMLLDLFVATSSARVIRVRLGRDTRGSFRRQDILASTMFLVTPYRGASIGWTAPRTGSPGDEPRAESTERVHAIAPGTIAVVRGGRRRHESGPTASLVFEDAAGGEGLSLMIDDAIFGTVA